MKKESNKHKNITVFFTGYVIMFVGEKIPLYIGEEGGLVSQITQAMILDKESALTVRSLFASKGLDANICELKTKYIATI